MRAIQGKPMQVEQEANLASGPTDAETHPGPDTDVSETSTPAADPSSPQSGETEHQAEGAEDIFAAVEKVVPSDTEKDVLAETDPPAKPSDDEKSDEDDEDDKDADSKDAEADAQSDKDADKDAQSEAERQEKLEARRKAREEREATPDFTSADMKSLKPWARRKVRHLQDQLATASKDAEVKQNLDSFLTTNHIDGDQFNALMSVGAAMSRGDWAFVRNVMEPYWNLAMQATGGSMSPEARKMVEQGHMTEQAARQMTQQDMQRRQAELERQRYVDAEKQAQEAQVNRAHVEKVVTAVNDWEQSVRASDPDYDRKSDAIRDMLQGIKAQRGDPKTPQEAVEMAKAAYEKVNGFAKTFAPARRSTSASPSSVNQSPSASRDPNSLEDAMLAGLQRARS